MQSICLIHELLNSWYKRQKRREMRWEIILKFVETFLARERGDDNFEMSPSQSAEGYVCLYLKLLRLLWDL